MGDERDAGPASRDAAAPEPHSAGAADATAVVMRTLAASVAHRINNPLCYSLADLSLIATEIAVDADPATARRAAPLFEAITCLLRIRDVVASLANFTRTERSRPFDVVGVVEGAVDLVRAELEPHCELAVRVDEVELPQSSAASLALLVICVLMHGRDCLDRKPAPPSGGKVRLELRLFRGSHRGQSVLSLTLRSRDGAPAPAPSPRESLWLQIARPVAQGLAAEITRGANEPAGNESELLRVRFRAAPPRPPSL